MTRKEFLDGLREKLSGSLPAAEVQNHIAYYNDYIKEEVKKGRREEDILEELGDPWAIARSLIGASGAQSRTAGETYYEPEPGRNSRRDSASRGKVHVFGLDTWWKSLLFLLGVIGVLVLVIAVIGGILSLLAPILVPLLLIVIVMRMINRRR